MTKTINGTFKKYQNYQLALVKDTSLLRGINIFHETKKRLQKPIALTFLNTVNSEAFLYLFPFVRVQPWVREKMGQGLNKSPVGAIISFALLSAPSISFLFCPNGQLVMKWFPLFDLYSFPSLFSISTVISDNFEDVPPLAVVHDSSNLPKDFSCIWTVALSSEAFLVMQFRCSTCNGMHCTRHGLLNTVEKRILLVKYLHLTTPFSIRNLVGLGLILSIAIGFVEQNILLELLNLLSLPLLL